MNVKEAAKLVGRKGRYRHRELGTLLFPVVVLDVREMFGRTDVLVRPIGGGGMHWVDLKNVTLDKP